MSAHESTVAAGVIESAQLAVQRLSSKLHGIRSVIVATADGFDLAHTGHRAIDPARVAAMAASFAAVGDAAARETEIGTPHCLVIDSTLGRLVVRCFTVHGESLIVAVLTDKSVLLGLVWDALVSVEKQMADGA